MAKLSKGDKAAVPSRKITLIATDEKSPRIKIGGPATLEIVEIQAISPESKNVDLIASRLCGYGSNVCLALVEL